MISNNSFDKNVIRGFRGQRKYSKIDVGILEKMTYALYLVETLKLEGFNFIFKGGTSLALLIPEIRRFSIDVDIICENSQKNIENVLKKICSQNRFKRYELDNERSYKPSGIPKAHYYLFYDSVISNKEENILFDTVFYENFYPETISKPIINDFLLTEGDEVSVTVPSINSITGDKLTAFAPNTSGYLYGKGNGLQTIKQLFDLGFLFDLSDNFEVVANTTIKKFDSLKKYVANINTLDDILNDVINTSYLLAKFQSKKKDEEDKFNELHLGIRQISNFLIYRPFNVEKAVEFVAKSSLLAGKILKKNYETLEDFDNTKDYKIENENLKFLNILKNIQNKSHFYFYQLAKLIS